MTDVSASELNTNCELLSGAGCVSPPAGPGSFYPFWTLARVNGTCVWELGNMADGASFGGASRYGTVRPGSLGAGLSSVTSGLTASCRSFSVTRNPLAGTALRDCRASR